MGQFSDYQASYPDAREPTGDREGAVMQWTKPYCGVTHLLGTPKGTQISITSGKDWAQCWIAGPSGRFWTGSQTKNFRSISAAKAWGEKQARLRWGGHRAPQKGGL